MILIKRFLRSVFAVWYLLNDSFKHFIYSAPNDNLVLRNSKEYSKITILEKDLHRIEKGLSLLNAKKSFGAEPAKRIASFINNSSVASDSHLIERARVALDARNKWMNFGDRSEGILTGKVSPFPYDSKSDLFQKFFTSRRSIRNFVGFAPSVDQIVRAIEWSINTPSVCNRQGWFVWYVSEENLLHKILLLQNGNVGLNNLKGVLIFGMDRKKYTLGSERNQIWIDGGLFAMSTVWALHAQGLGTCFLNWATSSKKSQMLRSLLEASGNIEFITLCAVGNFESDTLVAISPRNSSSQYLKYFN